MFELEIDAKINKLEEVLNFVNEHLNKTNCPEKTRIQVDIAVEEIFVNIAHYAYNPKVGKATIRVEITDNPVSISLTFMDNGKPYDPLAKKDPDVTLSAEQRTIGGLGIYMVKKSMDEIQYTYKNGTNVLTFKKKL
jgi:anti-sigma regulatory factor (Ser/Thr protein kinase)